MDNQINKTGFGVEPRPFVKKYYLRKDLERMTTYQLREICFEQRLAKSIISPLDKNELIRLIVRYRGLAENSLIKDNFDDGVTRIRDFLEKVKFSIDDKVIVKGPSTIVAYQGIRMDYLDDYTITYDEQFAQTNALLVGSNNSLCGIFNIERFGNNRNNLYITKSSDSFISQAENKHYDLYLFNKHSSEFLYQLYMGKENVVVPKDIKVCSISILDFQIKNPLDVETPLVIDFGTSTTSAAVKIDETAFHAVYSDIKSKFHDEDINYVSFIDTSKLEYEVLPIIPSVIGVIKIHDEDNIDLAFGYDALKVSNISLISEGFCIFYDIKRWVSDLEKSEELIDRNGARAFVPRKVLLSKFINYIIEISQQRFKSRFKRVILPFPVKQREQFFELISNMVTDGQEIQFDLLIDESVAVLYNTMNSLIKKEQFRDGSEYSALVLDFGGGTTNLSSCVFSITNQRVSYKIDINTSYENGDSDFGGNNLTFIIMQFLKIAIAQKLTTIDFITQNKIIEYFDKDIYRYIDEYGYDELYKLLELEYQKAEQIIPTKFKKFENDTKEDYFRVKNNFYFLFGLAEKIKHEVFNNLGISRICLSDVFYEHDYTTVMEVERWKLSYYNQDKLQNIRKFPEISINSYDVNCLLKGAVYNIFKRFLDRIYEDDEIFNYSIIKLNGLSCKMEIFRDALKEFVPGKIVQFKKQNKDSTDNYEMKLGLLRGMVNYITAKEYGFANFNTVNNIASLPYVITVDTHTGNEKTLIHSLDKYRKNGNISRSMDKLTLKLYLKDTDENTRCEYIYNCEYDDFVDITYEKLSEDYEEIILQEDTDSIVTGEVKFFVWADDDKWGFNVLSVLRNNESQLMMGKAKFFSFESDLWVKNFFDGLK